MVLKFKDGITPEDVILEILQAPDTKIILLSETQEIDKDKEIGIVVFVLQITFAKRFTVSFDRRGLPLSSGNVIILKFFVYLDNHINTQIVDNEVNTQTRLALQEISQQICPSVLYCKDITGDAIDNAINDLLNRNKAEKKSNILSRAEPNIMLGDNMYHYISTKISRLTGNDCKKKAFFMEFFSCKTLLEFCEIPENFNMGNSVTSIDGIQVTIGHTPNTTNSVLGLDKDSFKKMTLHYVTLKLFKFNCIHGDLHASNVYVLLDDTNIVFLVIDLGHGKIDDNLQLKLYEVPIPQKANIEDTLNFNLARTLCIKGQPAKIHAIRLTNLYLELKPDTVIKPIIDNKIVNNSYFDAVVMINMCIDQSSLSTSTFLTYLTKQCDIFTPLYCCYKDLKTETMCNQIIEQCLYTRTESTLKSAMITDGGTVYKNRINKFIASKQINRKSKKRKNKTINRKKSRKITRKKLNNRSKK